MFDLIAFDADDTLWHNETLFQRPQAQFPRSWPATPRRVDRRAAVRDRERNLRHFGYGIKGFTLSMIETAIELTEGRVTRRRDPDASSTGATRCCRRPVALLDGRAETSRRWPALTA